MTESLEVAAGVFLCLVLPLTLSLLGCWAIMNLLALDIRICLALLFIMTATLSTYALTQTVTSYMNAGDINRHLK